MKASPSSVWQIVLGAIVPTPTPISFTDKLPKAASPVICCNVVSPWKAIRACSKPPSVCDSGKPASAVTGKPFWNCSAWVANVIWHGVPLSLNCTPFSTAKYARPKNCATAVGTAFNVLVFVLPEPYSGAAGVPPVTVSTTPFAEAVAAWLRVKLVPPLKFRPMLPVSPVGVWRSSTTDVPPPGSDCTKPMEIPPTKTCDPTTTPVSEATAVIVFVPLKVPVVLRSSAATLIALIVVFAGMPRPETCIPTCQPFCRTFAVNVSSSVLECVLPVTVASVKLEMSSQPKKGPTPPGKPGCVRSTRDATTAIVGGTQSPTGEGVAGKDAAPPGIVIGLNRPVMTL